jgi:hypothetical protein
VPSARDEILARVRAALGDVPAGEPAEPPTYEPPPAPDGDAVARFAERGEHEWAMIATFS